MATPAAALILPAVVGGLVGGVTGAVAGSRMDDRKRSEGSSARAPVPGPVASDGEGRISCFLLGGEIHDWAGDVGAAVGEMQEAKAGQVVGRTAGEWLDELGEMLRDGGEKARRLGCLPPDVDDMVGRTVAAIHGGDTDGAMRIAHELEVRLGDPPLLRNLRRYEEMGGNRGR